MKGVLVGEGSFFYWLTTTRDLQNSFAVIQGINCK